MYRSSTVVAYSSSSMSAKLVLAVALCMLAYTAVAERRQQFESQRQFEAKQCMLERISTSQPFQRLESEGGLTEFWNPEEDQFQCAGVAAFRNTIRPNCMTVPMSFPAPRLVFMEQGCGVVQISYPGCPETFHSEQQFSRGQFRGGERGDTHQKVHRVCRGDIVAIPAGAAHWCYNDGTEELVSVSVVDLNNQANQLDQNLRGFMMGGGQPREGMHRYERAERRPRRGMRSIQETFQSVFRGFDREMLAEAFNVPTNVVERMQRGSQRGLIVRSEREMRFMIPDEQEEERRYREMEMQTNGLEETFCTMRIKQNMEFRKEADFFTRQGGKINIANRQKLPILGFLDMSAERGHLMRNAMYTPHWSVSENRVLYALRGEMQVQVVDDMGNTVMNEKVQRGEMFVVPQFFATIMRAGEDGFEWVSFKTSGQPMKSAMAGSASVMRAMPIDVIANAYQISPGEAQQLKFNRDPQSMVLSPTRRTSY